MSIERLCLLLALLLCCSCAAAGAQVVEMREAQLRTGAPGSEMWQSVGLPDIRLTGRDGEPRAEWYRISFDARAAGPPLSLYLPYFYNGGSVFLNRQLLATVPTTNQQFVFRWERPHLVHIPGSLLHPGRNVLHLRVAYGGASMSLRTPRMLLGERSELQSRYETRLFWVRTIPQMTFAAFALMSAMLLFIWLRRRQESLYGLLGIASFLWGVRTLTFVFEHMSVELWLIWRVIYHTATGGVVVTMALFALEFSGLKIRWLQRTLLAYWACGPIILAWNVRAMEELIGRLWTGGMLLIAFGVLALSVRAALIHRTWQAIALCIVVSLAFIGGLHDYLLATSSAWMIALAPDWAAERLFLLHYAGNTLLLVLAGILMSRFVQTLDDVEQINTTLEARIAQREREREVNYAQLARLGRERAIEEERERIMRDMHDGLGSQLFTSLSRVERSSPSKPEILDMLRGCIAEMRLALDALSPTDDDFQAVLGNFRYRWEAQLTSGGIKSTWALGAVSVAAHQRLDLLRIMQEALTNIMKHAHATCAHIEAVQDARQLRLEIRDDGCGAVDANPAGRGLTNMRHRAQRIGARLEFESQPRGTRVTLLVPSDG